MISNIEIDFDCPLICKKIIESECYDIQMVLGRFVKETILDFKLDREKGNELCLNCLFNQLNP